MAKILVSVDDRLLAQIDRAARKSGLTRSAYLARLASRELETERGPGSDKRVARAMSSLDELFRGRAVSEDPTGAVRAGRDSR